LDWGPKVNRGNMWSTTASVPLRTHHLRRVSNRNGANLPRNARLFAPSRRRFRFTPSQTFISKAAAPGRILGCGSAWSLTEKGIRTSSFQRVGTALRAFRQNLSGLDVLEVATRIQPVKGYPIDGCQFSCQQNGPHRFAPDGVKICRIGPPITNDPALPRLFGRDVAFPTSNTILLAVLICANGIRLRHPGRKCSVFPAGSNSIDRRHFRNKNPSRKGPFDVGEAAAFVCRVCSPVHHRQSNECPEKGLRFQLIRAVCSILTSRPFRGLMWPSALRQQLFPQPCAEGMPRTTTSLPMEQKNPQRRLFIRHHFGLIFYQQQSGFAIAGPESTEFFGDPSTTPQLFRRRRPSSHR